MKTLIYLGFLVVLLTTVSAIEECKGTVNQDDVPCRVLLPYRNNCSVVTVSYYYNTSFLHTDIMANFTPFLCNSTFNYSQVGSYTFNYSTGDTGSIVVEEDFTLSFFNLTIYLVFFGLGIIFLILMHTFKEDQAASMIYGIISTLLLIILGGIILSPEFTIIRGISFIIDIDYYIAILMFSIALYTGVVSYFIFKDAQPKKVEGW